MEHSRDEETEAMLGEIIANGSDDVAHFSSTPMVSWMKKRAMFMMASAH